MMSEHTVPTDERVYSAANGRSLQCKRVALTERCTRSNPRTVNNGALLLGSLLATQSGRHG